MLLDTNKSLKLVNIVQFQILFLIYRKKSRVLVGKEFNFNDERLNKFFLFFLVALNIIERKMIGKALTSH